MAKFKIENVLYGVMAGMLSMLVVIWLIWGIDKMNTISKEAYGVEIIDFEVENKDTYILVKGKIMNINSITLYVSGNISIVQRWNKDVLCVPKLNIINGYNIKPFETKEFKAKIPFCDIYPSDDPFYDLIIYPEFNDNKIGKLKLYGDIDHQRIIKN